ncbi:MAG: LysR family transcriptional regulator, partial [Pygmaiobacter sp.]
MNFLNLYYFVVVAEERNFSRAAKQLFISQQSLSNHIKKLETENGVLLFDRHNPITLTEAGESLFRNAKAILLLQQKAEKELLDIKDFRQGEITVGIAPSRGNIMLPPLISEYHHRFPQVRIHVYEGDQSALRDRLELGKIDLAIGFDFQSDLIETQPLFLESQYIVVPAPILKQYFSEEERQQLLSCESLPLQTFAHCPFVVANSSSWTGQLLHRMSSKEDGFEPLVAAHTYNTLTMLALCRAGLGISLCAKTFLWDDLKKGNNPTGDLFCFLLDDSLGSSQLVIGVKKGSYHTRAVNELIKAAKEVFDQYRGL